MENQIELKITGDADEAVSSPSNVQAKKRPDSLLGHSRDPPPLMKGHSIEISASPRNSLTVALAMVAYPFKKNLDGTVEQFIHTPTTPNSDPRLQKTSAYTCALKTTNSSDKLPSIKAEEGHDNNDSGKANQLEVQSSKQKNLKLPLAPELSDDLRPRSRSRSGMRRRNVEELVGLSMKMSNLSNLSMNSVRSGAFLSASSSRVSIPGALHPLDKQSLKNFKR